MDLLEEKLERKNRIETAEACVELITSRLSGTNFQRDYLKGYIVEAIDNSEIINVRKEELKDETRI